MSIRVFIYHANITNSIAKCMDNKDAPFNTNLFGVPVFIHVKADDHFIKIDTLKQSTCMSVLKVL